MRSNRCCVCVLLVRYVSEICWRCDSISQNSNERRYPSGTNTVRGQFKAAYSALLFAYQQLSKYAASSSLSTAKSKKCMSLLPLVLLLHDQCLLYLREIQYTVNFWRSLPAGIYFMVAYSEWLVPSGTCYSRILLAIHVRPWIRSWGCDRSWLLWILSADH